MNEFEEIFYECEDISTQDMYYYLSTDESELHLVGHTPGDCEIGRISKLSEVFLEWYLFESDTEKNIKTFLESEGLSDVFTETQFMDLMCGKAYLDNVLLQFVALKLPFYIAFNKLQRINAQHAKGICLIKFGPNIFDKIRETVQENNEAISKRKKEYRHNHHMAHREHNLAMNRQWILEHFEQYQAYQKQWRTENREHLQEYQSKYRRENATAVAERKKKCYRAKKEQYQKQNRENYSKNKERYLAQQKAHRIELQQKAISAQKFCAAYVFLLQLRKTDKAQYQMLYRPQQNPLIQMLRNCPALQNMDASLCPFCNSESGQSVDKCCNPKVLALPWVIDKVQQIASALIKDNVR